MKTIFLRHLQVLFDTFGRMAKSPVPTLVTVIIIAVAIALPLILFKVSTSLESVAGQWQGNPEITVFVTRGNENGGDDPAADRAVKLGHRLLEIPTIRDVEYISSDRAFDEFKQISGFGDVLNTLLQSPLPPLLIIYPEPDLEAGEIQTLVEKLDGMDDVDSISYDQQWLEKLSAIVDLFGKAVLILTCLMSVAVVLIVSNTIRLGILDRADEIEIIDQIGGTAAFIQRPFLYFGVIQSAAGAIFALIIANLALYVLSRPVDRLTSLYQSSFEIGWTSAPVSAAVLLLSVSLGWLAAKVTAGNYLRRLRAIAREK